MEATPEQLLDVHAEISKHAVRLVEGVTAEQWSQPTPCTEWDVRALVNHMASGMRTALCSKPNIPDAVTQGPQEGQIPAADNNRKGEKTMESLAKQGKKEDKKSDDDKDE